MEYFFGEHLRLDWGLDNPNKTAAIIAGITIATWLIAGVWKNSKICYLIAGLAFFYGGALLLETYSRGGIVALTVGLIPVLLWVSKKRSKFEIAYFLALMVGLGLYAQKNEVSTRISPQYINEDTSVSNRVEIYKQIPKMLADNPHGWGWGKSGEAYGDFYQSLEHNEDYRTLVNYHATILTEVPWWGRIMYVSAWALLIALVLPSKQLELIPCVCSGVILSFFLACSFSTLGETWQTWLPTIGATALVSVWRIYNRQSWHKQTTTYLILAANLLLFLLCLTGEILPRSEHTIAPASDRIIIQRDL